MFVYKMAAATIALAMTTFSMTTNAANAADFPAPKTGEWIAKNFKFHTGEVMPEVRLNYVTIGEPSGEPVIVLHGTGNTYANMTTPAFAGELFGPGQPLDAKKYYIIIPEALGHGQSSKPSDGLKTKFPQYNYADMVDAQYRLVKEGLGIPHVRMVIGNSMGGMHTWLMASRYPDFADIMVPMASQPTAMASRNWMLRRVMLEMIRNDSEYNNGNYTSQPRVMKIASTFYFVATAGGTLAYQKNAPTAKAADKFIDDRLAANFTADANNFLYAWESSHDYDASLELEKIQATLLAINAADDERNPPETGIMEREMKRVKNGKLFLIPASEATTGHLTTGNAKFYKDKIEEVLRTTPKKTM